MEDGVNLLESIGLHNKEIFHIDAHLQRLAASWAALQLAPKLDLDAIREAVIAASKKLEGKELMMLRVVACPKDGTFEVNHRLLQGWTRPKFDLPRGVDLESLRGFRREKVRISTAKTYTWTKFMMHKTTDRGSYDVVKQSVPNSNNLFDVLITNTHGFVTEGCVANVAFHIRSTNEWITPPITDGLLPGVLRRKFLEAGHMKERSITPAQIKSPDVDLVVCFNSVRGVVLGDVEGKEQVL